MCNNIWEIESDDVSEVKLYKINFSNDQPVEAKPATEELEDDGHAAMIDELKQVNLGTEEDPRPTFISSLLPKDQVE
ncbi:hypothetical protein MA16_Dca018415 [Dendrobium catenatum]|uniref:Uncharacterized protein n=1 Tax=Dendrobium catenatum TaxID=906689 RepID=A0A2I0WHM2_9ASPA|nr:hypothetical protein MA16_Dca018415 [Dendrobium catenatum]